MPRLTPVLAVAACCGITLAASQSHTAPDLFVRADKGHCIACHQVAPGAGPETRSNFGPRLEGSRMRALGRSTLRELINDPTRANADTVMTPYGRHRVLDGAEIDRLVEYLHALP